jgi:hypothetical protein
LLSCGRFHAAERSPELPQNSRVLVVSLAVFLWNVCSLHVSESTATSDFRFWEGQEEEIYRGYLQIASYIGEKERAQPASRMAEDML